MLLDETNDHLYDEGYDVQTGDTRIMSRHCLNQ